MNKLDGKICDICRTRLYPGDKVYELCHECANLVWCVINVYEDDSRELSSIHHTKESAELHVEKAAPLIEKMNREVDNKIIDQSITQWVVL